ncbi:MAG: hypothetical protein ACFCD0_20020 [Gemmataceae bacterium]
MNHVTICPTCQQALELPEEYVGRQVQCATCDQVFLADPASPSQEQPSEGPTASQQSWTDDYDYKETHSYTEPKWRTNDKK